MIRILMLLSFEHNKQRMMLLRRKLTSRGINISYDKGQQSRVTAVDGCFVLIKTQYSIAGSYSTTNPICLIIQQLFAEVEVNAHH